MKSVNLKTVIVGFLAISALACKKSDSSPSSKTKTVLLTQSSWKIQTVAVDLNKDGTPDADATSYFQSCDLDNTYTFKTDNTGVMDEGATICDSSNPQTRSFTWLFKSNESIISGDFISTDAADATLISINDSNLVISYDYVDNSTTYRVIATLKH